MLTVLQLVIQRYMIEYIVFTYAMNQIDISRRIMTALVEFFELRDYSEYINLYGKEVCVRASNSPF